MSPPWHSTRQKSRRRAASFAGFFGKLFPSHRPEQGSTLQDAKHSGDSAYHDLGIDTEELTQWNIAQDITPGRRAELDMQLQGQRRSSSPGPKKLITSKATPCLTFENKPSHPIHAPIPLSPSIPNRAVSLSASQTHALLRSKEQTRRQRRELKASGDFLPVTGYNPWSGEWDVLTPTDTLSSDATSPSTEEKMIKLAQKVEEAKMAYLHARNRQESEKEKIKLEKAQAKLAKIEKTKNHIRRQGSNIKWSTRRGQWSSAAEPNLSPIAQSANSAATNPSNQSTDTIIHTPARRESSHVVHFLWRRHRRPKNPGVPGGDQAIAISSSTAGMKARSHSTSTLLGPNPLIELEIPDHHLDLLPRTKEAIIQKAANPGVNSATATSSQSPAKSEPGVRQGSVFTHITTTTGCDLEPANIHHGQLDGHTENMDTVSVIPTSPRYQDRTCVAWTAMQEQDRTLSHRATPQNGSSSIVSRPETPETDTASIHHVTPRRSYLNECTLVTPRLCKTTREKYSNEGMGNTSTSPSADMSLQAPRHRPSEGTKRQAAVQAAARTAMHRSRSRIADALASVSRRRSKTPSPIRPACQSQWTEADVRNEPEKPVHGGGGTVDHSRPSDPGSRIKTDGLLFVIFVILAWNSLRLLKWLSSL
ncbi:hypothetical protein JX266_004484 [Neoarthrinium moseri]|nr:hypothetical protein JX266_004484 [Neoarthrinium moseri]